MQFKDVVGQKNVKEHLVDMAQRDAIPHAQLFLAYPGAGGLPLALAFAQYLVCEQRAESDSCGTCPACVKSAKLIHPDIHYTYPIIARKPSPHPSLSTDYIQEWRMAVTRQAYLDEIEWLNAIEAENKQGNISADEARAIIRNLSLTPFESKYKIHIIWMAEALGKEGNILLKLLEEPTDDTILILVAEQAEEILPTILSRCQLVKIPVLDDDSIREGLAGRGVEPDKASRVAFLAQGSFGEALKIAENELDDSAQLLTEWLKHTIWMESHPLVRWIDEHTKMGREQLKAFLEYFLHVMRETMMAMSVPGYQARLSVPEKRIAQALHKYVDLEKFSRIAQLVDKKHYEIERNVNPKIVFLNLSLGIHKIISNK